MSFGNGEYYRQVIEGDRRELVEPIGMSQKKMGHCGLEPQTSVLSGLRSNQLS